MPNQEEQWEQGETNKPFRPEYVKHAPKHYGGGGYHGGAGYHHGGYHEGGYNSLLPFLALTPYLTQPVPYYPPYYPNAYPYPYPYPYSTQPPYYPPYYNPGYPY